MAGGGWSVEERLAGIPAQGDPLERLAATVGFAVSRARPVLARARGGRRRWKGGRPGFDPVLEFRALGLQSLHGPSLEATGHPVRDRTRDSAPPAPIVGGPEGSGWRVSRTVLSTFRNSAEIAASGRLPPMSCGRSTQHSCPDSPGHLCRSRFRRAG